MCLPLPYLGLLPIKYSHTTFGVMLPDTFSHILNVFSWEKAISFRGYINPKSLNILATIKKKEKKCIVPKFSFKGIKAISVYDMKHTGLIINYLPLI